MAWAVDTSLSDTPVPPTLAHRSGAFTFTEATPADDSSLRQLLRESIMPGPIALTLEREPSFFRASSIEGDQHQTMLCRDAAGNAIGLATRAVRETFLNNTPARTGYLGNLRLASTHLGSFHLVTRGYRLLKQWHEHDGQTHVYLTSILDSNAPARRLLESGRRGIPTYRPLDQFETSILNHAPMPTRPGATIRHAAVGEETAIAAFLNAANAQFCFAPVWSARRLQSLAPFALTMDRFIIAEHAGKIVACAALWDQRSFKQTVVRDYSPWLRACRPAINALSKLAHRPSLPPVGNPLPLQILSHAACTPGHEDAFACVLNAASTLCRSEHCSLVAGFARKHPLAPVLSRTRRRLLTSTLFAVSWHDGDEQSSRLVGSTPHPEVALL